MNPENRLAAKVGAAASLSLLGTVYAYRLLRVWLPPALGGGPEIWVEDSAPL